MFNFKSCVVFFQLVLFTLIISCSKPLKEVEVDKIQVRNGLYYEINVEKPFTGNIVDFFKNGQKQIQLKIENGKPEGKVIYWDENGFKDREFFVEGFDTQINGSKFEYDHTNHLILNGQYIKYHKENGQKQCEGNYKSGKRNGQWLDYYANGQKMDEGNYKNDEPDGKWIEWNENGQKKYERFWKDGKKDGKETVWNEKGIKKSEINYKEGKRHGKNIYFYDNGKKSEEIDIKADEYDGKRLTWYENGIKQIEHNYKEGKKNGIQIAFNEEGKKQFEMNFVEGILDNIIVYDTEFFKKWHMNEIDADLLLKAKVSEEWILDRYDFYFDPNEWNRYRGSLTFCDYGDFNADGKIDVAIGARSKKNIYHDSRIFVLWGPSFDSKAEIGWSKPFKIIKAGKISGWENTSLTMKGDGIEMVQPEVSAWIMYWDGNEFKRFQTSD